MNRRTVRSGLLAATATATALVTAGLPAAQAAHAAPGTHDRAATQGIVAQVRQATAQYRDVSVALAAGYFPTGECTEEAAGGMGIHYLNPSLIAPGAPVDPTKPQLLLYGPDGKGGLRLLGAEFFQPEVGQPRPMLGGEPFNGPMPGHEEGMPTHYDLHVWTEVANPTGVFSSFNPRVSC